MSSCSLKRACSDDGGVKLSFSLKLETELLICGDGSEQNVGVNLQHNRVCLQICVRVKSSWISYVHFPTKILSAFHSSGVFVEMHAWGHTHTHTHTAAVNVFPADSISISLLLHYDSIPHSAIHTIRLTENSTIVNSASLWSLWGFNACPDGFPEINIFKVAQQLYSILIHNSY